VSAVAPLKHCSRLELHYTRLQSSHEQTIDETGRGSRTNISLSLSPNKAFKFRRGQYFWHTRAIIGQAAARAVARRVQVAEHTLRRHRVLPYMQDNLAFLATLPSADV
jgi:hypothetical protein